MANPNLQFASIEISQLNLYSTASNTTSFIRVTGDFVNSSNTITNVTNVVGYYGTSSISPGMSVRSTGEITSIATITNFDSGSRTITLDQPAIASATGQTIFIMPGTGMYYIKDAVFNKVGGSVTNPPSDFRGVTGSLDANYNSNTIPWGVVGQLAATGSVGTALTGLFGQYNLVKIPVRTSNTVVDLILTASSAVPAFTQPSGYALTTSQTKLYLAQVSGSFMPLAAATDAGVNQGLGLAPYNTIVGSTLANFASGSTGGNFPFTGSADITGSLQVTGSVVIEQPVGNVNAFLIKSGSGAGAPALFNVNAQGVVQFFAHANDYVPTAVLGGMYFTSQSVYVGIE
jgi:hypothetical protein